MKKTKEINMDRKVVIGDSRYKTISRTFRITTALDDAILELISIGVFPSYSETLRHIIMFWLNTNHPLKSKLGGTACICCGEDKS